MFRTLLFACLILLMHVACAEHDAKVNTKSIPISELKGYAEYPAKVHQLITAALLLTQKQITYLYGSSDPKNKGMDCSGTIYYLLQSEKVKGVPRQANQMYTWAEKKGKLYLVTNQDVGSAQYAQLKPGDLLFWSGTYAVHRDPPITHVMIYLGVDKHNKPLMFGASDGRTYRGVKMNGVSVFDFKTSSNNSVVKFEGYSCIPELTCNRKPQRVDPSVLK